MIIARDNQVFQKYTFLRCKNKGKFIVFEKLDCNCNNHLIEKRYKINEKFILCIPLNEI
jgi:hypothetical protein